MTNLRLAPSVLIGSSPLLLVTKKTCISLIFDQIGLFTMKLLALERQNISHSPTPNKISNWSPYIFTLD